MNALLNTLVALLALLLGALTVVLFAVPSMAAFNVLIVALFVVIGALFVASDIDHRRKMAAIRTRRTREAELSHWVGMTATRAR